MIWARKRSRRRLAQGSRKKTAGAFRRQSWIVSFVSEGDGLGAASGEQHTLGDLHSMAADARAVHPAAFAGAILHFDSQVDGSERYWIEQGMEMGRPSRIRLELEIDGSEVAAARIGGHAVRVAEGTLLA